MLKTLVTHPDNKPLLEQFAKQDSEVGALANSLFGLKVRFNRNLERDQPTGKIIAPDGTISDRTGWSFRGDPFTTYEECDLHWLLYIGAVREEREPLFYLVDDMSLLMPRFDMRRPSPRFVFAKHSVF